MKNYLVLIIVLLFFACKSKNKDVKQAIAVHAKEELMFAGINYNVRNGVSTLTSNCPSEELKNNCKNNTGSQQINQSQYCK